MTPNAQGKRRRSTEGAQGTNKGHENAEGMAFVGVRLTAQLGQAADFQWCPSLVPFLQLAHSFAKAVTGFEDVSHFVA